MRFMRSFPAALAILALGISPVHAERNIDFGSPADQWYEISVSGGWGLFQSAPNNDNLNGGSPYLFEDGPASSATIRAEVGWGISENLILSAGLWYSRASADASSDETTPANYEQDPNDDFTFYRSVTHHLTAPYMKTTYLFRHSGKRQYFLSGGMILGIGRATLKHHTTGLDIGEISSKRNLGDTRIGIFGSLGLRQSLSGVFSFEGEIGYRYFERMQLDLGENYIVTPPIGPMALVVQDELNVDYAGPFAMVSITLRP
jgi:hypothetical protein